MQEKRLSSSSLTMSENGIKSLEKKIRRTVGTAYHQKKRSQFFADRLRGLKTDDFPAVQPHETTEYTGTNPGPEQYQTVFYRRRQHLSVSSHRYARQPRS